MSEEIQSPAVIQGQVEGPGGPVPHQPGQQPPGKIRRGPAVYLIAIIIAAVVLGGAYTAYGYYDLFKSPKKVYLEAEVKSFKSKTDSFIKAYDEYYQKNIKLYEEMPVHSSASLTARLAGLPARTQDERMLLNLVNTSSLKFESAYNMKELQQHVKMDWAVRDKRLLGAELIFDKNRLYFAVPELYKKYGVIDLKDREALYSKYGISLPKKVVTYDEWIKALRIPQDEFYAIFGDYHKFYSESIKENQVTLKKAAFKEGDFEKNCREITVTFTPEETADMYANLLEKMAGDEKLINLIEAKYKKMIELMEDSGLDGKTLKKIAFDRQGLQRDLRKAGGEIKQGSGKAPSIKMVMYVDYADEILDRRLVVNSGSSGETVSMRAAYWEDGKKRKNLLFNLKGEGTARSRDDFGLDVKLNSEPQGSGEKGKLQILAGDSRGRAILNFSSDFTTSVENNKETAKVNFSLALDKAGRNLTGTMISTESGKDREKTVDRVIDMNLNLGAFNPGLGPASLSITAKNLDQFGKKLDLPAVPAASTVDLANITPAEKEQISKEISQAALVFMMKNQNIFR